MSRLERLAKIAVLVTSAETEARELVREHQVEEDGHIRLDLGHIRSWLRGEIRAIEVDGKDYDTSTDE